MAILKTRCPECNAPLKSSTGFTVGQTVCCPKCETYFAVEEPEKEKDESEEEAPKKTTAKNKATGAAATKKPIKADEDDEDETPKKKKKKRAYDEDEEPKRSYKNSPLRYTILGVLVVIMCVLGYMLYEKRKKEREVASGGSSSSTDDGPVVNPRIVNPKGGPQLQPIQQNLGAGNPKQNLPNLHQQAGAAQGPNFGRPPGYVPPPGSPEEQGLIQAFKIALVGTWTADLGDGVTEELTYTANGTYTQKLSGPTPTTVSGKYIVKERPVGTRTVKIQLDTAGGPRTITVTLEDDELQHPTLQSGVTSSFRKK